MGAKKKTSSKRAASKTKSAKSADMNLQEYMEASMKTKKRHGNFASYKRWPQEAKDDVRQMVEANDAGTAALNVKDAIAWLDKKHGLQVTKSHIMTFLERELNRTTWMR